MGIVLGIAFFSGLFTYSVMLVKAPALTIMVSAVFVSLLFGLYWLAYLTLTVRAFG